ncbi:MAG: hypothetical protein DMG48_05175 [Acidobacteria bacterium]|nr:MAG: hypothetical protein DMG48_05175 [Acidobacteriota bacterium]
MVRLSEQILQNNLQELRDLLEPSPVRAAMLDRIEHVRRNEELARSLGIGFPKEFQTLEVPQ